MHIHDLTNISIFSNGTVLTALHFLVWNNFVKTHFLVETLEPDVKILELAIKSSGRPDIVVPIPESGNPKGTWFTLKEASRYRMNSPSKSVITLYQASNTTTLFGKLVSRVISLSSLNFYAPFGTRKVLGKGKKNAYIFLNFLVFI